MTKKGAKFVFFSSNVVKRLRILSCYEKWNIEQFMSKKADIVQESIFCYVYILNKADRVADLRNTCISKNSMKWELKAIAKPINFPSLLKILFSTAKFHITLESLI